MYLYEKIYYIILVFNISDEQVWGLGVLKNLQKT